MQCAAELQRECGGADVAALGPGSPGAGRAAPPGGGGQGPPEQGQAGPLPQVLRGPRRQGGRRPGLRLRGGRAARVHRERSVADQQAREAPRRGRRPGGGRPARQWAWPRRLRPRGWAGQPAWSSGSTQSRRRSATASRWLRGRSGHADHSTQCRAHLLPDIRANTPPAATTAAGAGSSDDVDATEADDGLADCSSLQQPAGGSGRSGNGRSSCGRRSDSIARSGQPGRGAHCTVRSRGGLQSSSCVGAW
mmetsp:Transcript_53796/g.149289  ORF Transcript_53796/g.149289 Transcript_53796/m.149289 type:complete len:250 (+) Transcript_53796:267-1016(+)